MVVTLINSPYVAEFLANKETGVKKVHSNFEQKELKVNRFSNNIIGQFVSS